MSTEHYICISESSVGSHAEIAIKNESSTLYAITFPVALDRDRKTNNIFIKTKLDKNQTFIDIVTEYNSLKKLKQQVSILISFDLDENGELMAEALLENLISAEVLQSDIFRTPLTENGYIAVKRFSDTSAYKSFLYHQQQIMSQLKKSNLPAVGIIKAYAMKRLHDNKNGKFDISRVPEQVNSSGTSTATYVHNYLNSSMEK